MKCERLRKAYGPVVAVADVSLSVRRGECFGLLGPNGAGKTTTIEILEGLLSADAGDIEVLGRRWSHHAGELRQRLGIQLQETQLPDKLTVEETLRLFRSFYANGRTVDELLQIVGLEGKRGSRVGKLSGGQKQRLSLACALAGNPDLLFLDEPTTGLDPQSRRQLWMLLEQFRERGGSILITTHYMEEAEYLCDRVAVVDHGRIIAEGVPQELIARLATTHEVLLSVEEGGLGGFGSHVATFLAANGLLDGKLKFRPLMIPDRFTEQSSQNDMYAEAGLDRAGIVAAALAALGVDSAQGVLRAGDNA